MSYPDGYYDLLDLHKNLEAEAIKLRKGMKLINKHLDDHKGWISTMPEAYYEELIDKPKEIIKEALKSNIWL